MSWTLLTLWTSCCLVATSTNPALKDLPAHLPPLPDFKQPVDYIQWLRDRLTAPPGDDARPLYDEIFVQSGDSEAIQKAKSRLWGEDEKGRLEGMFTGDEEFPERYAWDPADHPKWEAAYQAQVAAGLPEKLRAIGKRKQLSQPFGFYDPREAITSSPGDEGGAASQPDIGLTAEDRLLINVLMPSLSPNRRIVKVLLQNAWRAPQGKVSPKAMEDAIRTAISVADQASSHTVIGHLVSNANHELIYMSMLRALRENVFGPSETVKMMQILSMQDKRIQTQAEYDSEEIAQMLDLLQFIYQPTPDGVPKPNPDRLKRLARYLAALKAAYPEYHETVLDVVGLIGKCDPQSAVQQIVDLYLARKIRESELPQEAESRVARLVNEFKRDPDNHVLVRQFAFGGSRAIVLSARAEATRRATHLLYALHCEKNRTGKWPALLREIRGLSRVIRTDPFSGKDFCYRIENDQPLLYSVASNGRDDGGKHDPSWSELDRNGQPVNADYVFWPIQPHKR